MQKQIPPLLMLMCPFASFLSITPSMASVFIILPSIALLFLILRALWITISCYILTPWRISRFMAKQGVRGPKPRFLSGNIFDVAALVSRTTSSDMQPNDHNIVGRLMPHYVLWSKQYGKRFIMWSGSEPRLCLSETDLIKELLSSKYTPLTGKSWFQKQGNKHFVGRGLLMANGQDWFHQRHIVAPQFMGEKLKGFHGYMVECARETIKSLRAALESGSNEVEISQYMTKLTADIISRTEFDSSYDKGQKIFHLIERMQQLTAQASRHLWFPGSRFFPSKYTKDIMQLKKKIEDGMMEIIVSKDDSVNVGRSSSYGKGLLAVLLVDSKKKDGFKYDHQLIMDECKTFFFAGHDTTSLLLTWTIMLLATNPTWQEKAREEVLQVCGRETPSPDHLSKLTLLHMVINESLRLYPPATLLPRMVFEDLKLGDLHIPKGLSIWIPVLAIHHNKELWGDDADEFNPERFAGRSFAMTRHFLPFAAGPRNCVGQAFAMMEAKIILAMLLSSFSFVISENYRHAPVNVLTLKPKYGVPVYLKSLDA